MSKRIDLITIAGGAVLALAALALILLFVP
jgi:hypothetical protein